MITLENFHLVLDTLGFLQVNDQTYLKTINGYQLKVDFANKKLVYPDNLITYRTTTLNFSSPENFVVFECIHNLLETGYKPEEIELERGKSGGHHDTGGYCDIIVYHVENPDDDEPKKVPYLLIECKTHDSRDSEFEKAWKRMQENGGQLFNYYDSFRQAEFLALYASDFSEGDIEPHIKVISMKDNPDYLEVNDKLDSFTKVSERKGEKIEFFNVWKNTYNQQLFNADIFATPFAIGERSRTLSDLREVSHEMIRGKYNQFAEILRKYNVSGRENAFDKLINLFLAKVVDEQQNAKNDDENQNLKFFWRGIYDSYFRLQDDLQELYKTGMEKFLGEEITHIRETQITEIFDNYIRGNPKTIKGKVLEHFRSLKYYTNNDFAFIDVHNKELFRKNAVILTEMIQMLQDIKLQSEEGQHQFLGDLFEGFLDAGVKQSEGQFFTPMPIVKFLISALPLKELLASEEPPKVVDYACGAGHFLTEFASQIKPLVSASGRNLADFYQAIHGIEKEYRLSKVAKVSAFMYGQDDINIVYGDALAKHAKIQDNSYSVLIANPPYSVKGFLRTLEDERKGYELNSSVSDADSFNAIETFFIERAKQLLKTDAVAAIILPSSILTNGSVYIKCREIILQYFDLVAIAEFGSGTFGKTGTNTATLFLRKKSDNPEKAKVYQDAVNDWFGMSAGIEKVESTFDGEPKSTYADTGLLYAYLRHCGFEREAYIAFLNAKTQMPEVIVQNEMFQKYRKAFLDSTQAKAMNQRNKKDLDAIDKESDVAKKTKLMEKINERIAQLEIAYLNFVKDIEKDKLRFFMLAYSNGSDVLVMKMPSDNKEKKAFLGYEWSSRRGEEGIKYVGVRESDDVLENAKGINQINTPLFNPQDLFDESKINSLIRQHFGVKASQQEVKIPENLANLVSLLPLTEMLDFGRVDFDKVIRTSIQNKIQYESKYPFKTIGEITSTIESGKRPSGGVGAFNEGAYSLGGEHIGKDNGRLELSSIKYVPQKFFNEAKRGIIQKSDILICKDGALTGKIALVRDELDGINAMINEHVFILRCADIDTQKYLFNYLFSEFGQALLKDNITGAAQGGLNSTNLKNIKIPFPPLEIQQKISKECEKIDDEFNKTRMEIDELQAKIVQIFKELDIVQERGGVKHFKINELCYLNPSKSEIKTLLDNLIVSFVEMASVSNDGFIEEKIDKPLGELRKGSYTYFRENDVIIAKITPCMENGKCALATNLSNGIGMGSSEFHVFRADESKILPAFLFYSLNRETIRKEAEKNMTGSSGHRRVPISFYEDLRIAVPPLAEQQSIIAKIQHLKNQIATLENKIVQTGEKKKAILEKYL